MVTESIQDKIERYKIRAEVFFKDGVRSFIVDYLDNYYFCDVLEVTENSISVKNFKGRKEGLTETIYFVDIVKFVPYKDKSELI